MKKIAQSIVRLRKLILNSSGPAVDPFRNRRGCYPHQL